jgi:hypothetical protein
MFFLKAKKHNRNGFRVLTFGQFCLLRNEACDFKFAVTITFYYILFIFVNADTSN